MSSPSAVQQAQPLAYCAYPAARAETEHGQQPLPDQLPLVDFGRAQPHRSTQYKTVRAAALTHEQLLQMARGVGASFAKRDPMSRHLQPPKQLPAELRDALHIDPLGASAFGDWQTGNIIGWFIRLFLLTDPTQPTPIPQLNDDVLQLSVAIVDAADRVLGGAFNETQAPMGVEPVFRADDPFLNAVMGGLDPILGLLGGQNAEAVAILCTQYPAFLAALENGKVGHHFMIARFEDLATLDAFELVAGTAEAYREQGYEYLITEATNQWTGAAFEALGGTRIHFSPFRHQPVVEASAEPLQEVVSSPDGFIADKDSGSMFYVLRFV